MYEEVFREAETRHGLLAGVLAAIAVHESSLNPYAIRYEPAFYATYLEGKPKEMLGGTWPRDVTEQTERRARAMSWGLLQVMGQVARQEGFTGRFLSELVSPEVGVNLGALHLKRHLRRYENDLPKALSAYNAGTATDRNRDNYVRPILARVNR